MKIFCSKHVWIKAVIVFLHLISCTNKPVAGNITENFDTDPGWTAYGLPVNNNDFGFRRSSFSGGEPGEAGGLFSATDRLVWYGDNSLGNVTAEQVIVASGTLNIFSAEPYYNNNVFIGHFAADDKKLSRAIGFQILEEPSGNQGINPSSFRIYYKIEANDIGAAGMPGEGLLFVITNTSEARQWRYQYDPADGDHGSLTISISGTGGNTRKVFLSEPQRRALSGMDSFGMAVEPQDQRPQQLELYIDNVTYSIESTSTLHPRVTLEKSVDNPAPSGEELVSFSIEVTNSGKATAEQVEVYERLPPDMAIPEGMAAFTSLGYYDPQTGIWDIGALAIDQDAVMTLPAQIVTKPQPPCVANSSHVNTSGLLTDKDEVILRRPDVDKCVDLSIGVIRSGTTIPNLCAPEQFLVYQFKITSGRSITARKVKLTISEVAYKVPGLVGKAEECKGLTCRWPSLAGDVYVSFESDLFTPDQSVKHRIEAFVESADGELTPENNLINATVEVKTRTPNCSGGGMDFSGLDIDACFISTAAYGSKSHPDVQVLREFRDQVLLQNSWGRAFVDFYYRHSPEIACAMAESPGMQLAVRSILKPVVLAIANPGRALLTLTATVGLLVWLLSIHRRQHAT